MIKTPPQQTLPIPAGRLNCYEFERRYNAMPRLRKAELIEGRDMRCVGALKPLKR